MSAAFHNSIQSVQLTVADRDKLCVEQSFLQRTTEKTTLTAVVVVGTDWLDGGTTVTSATITTARFCLAVV